MKKEQKREKRTVTLLGIEFDKKNTIIDGKKYFTFDEANEVAKSMGKRLLTVEEQIKLAKLPRVVDHNLSGIWIAEREEDLGNPDKAVFFPFRGFSYYDGTLYNQGSYAYYWSQTEYNATNGYYLSFSSNGNVRPQYYYAYKYTGFSLRCVK